MTTNVLTDILKWSGQQPGWQQDALRRLFSLGDLAPSDFDDLTEICEAKHGLTGPKTISPLTSAHLPITKDGTADAISLVKLTHHTGVNALAPEQTVHFGPRLTIVYGENAAGKSGYTRILKRSCRSRNVENILGNVLGTGAPLKAKATIGIREGDSETDLIWTDDGPPSPALAQISVFDAHCVPVYLRDKTDVAFRPFGLDVFDKLAAACAEIKKRLEAASQHLSISLLPALPKILPGTKARSLLDQLTALTKEEAVRTLAKLSGDEEKRLEYLTDLKRDIEAGDSKKRALELTAKATRFELLAKHLEALNEKVGLQALVQLNDSRKKLLAARATLTALQQSALTPDLLAGTGGQQWRNMWDATKLFAAIAQPASAFPLTEDGAKCPFCQQELDSDAVSRLTHLAEFISSTAQEDVRECERDYSLRWDAIKKVQVQRPEIESVITEVSSDDASLGSGVSKCLHTAQENRDRATEFTESKDGPLIGATLDPHLASAIQAVAAGLRSRAKELQSSATSLSASDQLELKELESRASLRDNLDIVLKEIERKIKVAAYGQCIADTSTLQTTKKSTELTKLLITEQLQQTFKSELKKLQFDHLSVEVRSAGGSKGALFHKLAFTNAPSVNVTDVLSEGESRALSLAAFLTELSTAPTRSGIIFDDPVSSLDHNWRDKIGRRLVAEAKDRQVVVFTHDLLFLRILLNECEKLEIVPSHQYIRRDVQAGICSPDLPWVAMNVNARLGVLKNRWQEANKLFSKNGMGVYEPVARDMFGQLRETWERAVSEVLLNDVVERFRFSIETKKVAPLHDITKADCTIVEDAMTECSRWMRGHDEALADGTPFPPPKDLKARIDELETWVKDIRKRRENKKKTSPG